MPCYRPSRGKRLSSGPQDTRWQPSQDDFELLLDMLFHTRIVCFPTKDERVAMANRLNVTERQVQVWCQNKRQKLRESGIGYSDARAPALVIAERGKVAPTNLSLSPVELESVPLPPRPSKMSPPARRPSRAMSVETAASEVSDDADYVPRATRTRPYAIPPRIRPISPIELISTAPVHPEHSLPPPSKALLLPRHDSPAPHSPGSLPDLAFDDDFESVASELESPPPSRNRRLSVAEITTPVDPRPESKTPAWSWAPDTHESSWSFQDRLATWAQNRFPEADLRSGGAGNGVKRVW
ncbi:homeobox domain protein [Ceratobasidium sp. AG-Ba]|nr:homeobox domain protein [Ceratobasidium sp. AG-Ba]